MIILAALRFLLSAPSVLKQDSELIQNVGRFVPVLEYLSGFSVPLLLIANFGRIMNNDGEYKNLLLSNGLAAVVVFGASWLLFSRYGVGTLRVAGDHQILQNRYIVQIFHPDISQGRL